jgi:oligopeptide/dipeptide ABC transporter ATP-binding protein
MSLLEVKALRVSIDTPAGRIHPVDDVSFTLEEGETVGLVGESGSGKSLTCLAVLGIVPAPGVIETGEVVLAGENLLAAGPARQRAVRGKEISMVFQDPLSALNPMLSIGTQLAEVLEVHEGLGRKEARRRAAAGLDDVGLAEPEALLGRYPHELSGGMRQRVVIAMALLCKPRVLIADEPTTALDAALRAQVLRLLGDLQRRHGTAILLVSHDLATMAGNATRVMVMYAGRVVETASTPELFQRPLHPYSLGLLRSMPTLTHPPEVRLPSIPGQPPELTALGEGCAFAPRCNFVQQRCKRERPPLATYLPRTGAGATVRTLSGRRAACFELEAVAAATPVTRSSP